MTPDSITRRDRSKLTRDALGRWLDAYGAAWEARDGDAAARLFSQSAVYHWGPFGPPLQGRAEIARRWHSATGDQREIRFEHTPLGTAGTHAFAHWRSTFVRLSTLCRVTLDGILVLQFAPDGVCTELREWWLGEERPA